MRSSKNLGKAAAMALAIATLASASAFAETRNQDRTWRDRNDGRGREERAYRNNERVTTEGRVRSFRQERDGYRVELDRGRYSYWVPRSHFGRGRDLRVGVSVRLGGVFHGGYVYVDDFDWLDRGIVRGVITDIVYRRDIVSIRDEYSGRRVRVDMRRADRYRRGIDVNDLRRGDYVTLWGEWDRGIFEAYEIESVRSRRW